MRKPTFVKFDTQITASYKYANWYYNEVSQDIAVPLRFVTLQETPAGYENEVEFHEKYFSTIHEHITDLIVEALTGETTESPTKSPATGSFKSKSGSSSGSGSPVKPPTKKSSSKSPTRVASKSPTRVASKSPTRVAPKSPTRASSVSPISQRSPTSPVRQRSSKSPTSPVRQRSSSKSPVSPTEDTSPRSFVDEPQDIDIDQFYEGSGLSFDPMKIYLKLKDANNEVTKQDVLFKILDFVPVAPEATILDLVTKVHAQLEPNYQGVKFIDYRDVVTQYDSWVSINSTQAAEERQTLVNTIDAIQETLEVLSESEWTKCSPVTINSVKVSYTPTMEGRKVTHDDGLEIFDYAVLSKHVPFIKYVNNTGRVYTKVYGDKNDNFSMVGLSPHEKNKNNCLYFTLWLGDGDNRPQKKSYYKGKYNLEKNSFKIETPVVTPMDSVVNNTFREYQTDEQASTARIKECFHHLSFDESVETKCKAEFYLYDFSYEEAYLLDLLLNEKIYSYYLYVDENSKPYALKKRLDIQAKSFMGEAKVANKPTGKAYIKNKPLITMNFKPSATPTKNTEMMINKEGFPYTDIIEEGSPFVKIKVTKCRSRKELEEFLPLLRILMASVASYSEHITVYNLFPELITQPIFTNHPEEEETFVDKSKKKPDTRSKAAIEELKRRAGDIFGASYSIKCQGPKKQPTIIENDQVSKYQSLGYETLPVPYFDKPRFSVYCPTGAEQKPMYPSVMPNPDHKIKAKYPWVPCCYSSPKYNAKDYQLYSRGMPPEEPKGTKTTNVIATDKFLPVGGKGKIHETILRTVGGSDITSEIQRYGVLRSVNSFLFCVLEALKDRRYMSIRTNLAEADRYATEVKNKILNQINISCMAQELYDYEPEDISQAFRQNDFFDPALFYRALEEYFNVNIYCFTLSRYGSAKAGTFDVPRHKLFHARPQRLDRQTICIYKNWGSKSNDLTYPQCELIVDTTQSPSKMVYDLLVTEMCHSAMQGMLRITTWNIDEQGIQAYDNMYTYVDLIQALQTKPVSQFVDRYGKLRALTFNTKTGKLTIITVPGQPENLPISNKIERSTYKDVMDMFGSNASSISKDVNGNVIGIWFKIMDIDNALYIATIPEEIDTDLPEIPQHPLMKTGNSFTGRLRKLRRCIHIITSIVRWLFDIFRMSTGGTLEEFSRYLVTDEYVGDSLEYYDVTKVKRFFPQARTLDEAIKAMSRTIPSLCEDGKIYLYAQDFYQPIISMLKDYENITAEDITKDHIPDRILDFYQTDKDFIQRSNTKIFTTKRDFEAWWDTLRGAGKYDKLYTIETYLNGTMSRIREPFMYEDPQGHIYLVQNVLNGSKSRAMAVGERWVTHLHNLGYEVVPSELQYVHKVYCLDPTYNIKVIDDKSEGNDRHLNILFYGGENDYTSGKLGEYAALLQIL